MSLNPGARLGPYDIVARLGAGGMGEVYRGRDSRLRREVAIKILPAEIADDPDRLARFSREAQAASALKHPNIVTVFDVGVDGRVHFLVMELVEGRSLRETIVRGGMPVKAMLNIAAQIAEGLANAHAAGIVHRDLKPENVMVTPEGLVKILDFGLAKLHPDRKADESATESLIESFQTGPGPTFGTPSYMSPEQTTGATVDFRSDQFSLGAILYELLSGRTAFRGPSTIETLSAIIKDEPASLASIRADLPAPLVWIIERCLHKDPRQRYDSTADLARDLINLRERASSVSSSIPVVAPVRSGRLGRAALWAFGLCCLLGTVAAAFLLSGAWRQDSVGDMASQPPLQMGIAGPGPTGTSMPFFPTGYTVALSPDGRQIALVGAGRLFLRAMDSFTLTALPGTEGAVSPEWSPDNRYIAFLAQGKLKRIDVRGGAVQDLADALPNGGISWGSSGTILFSGVTPQGGPAGIFNVSADGGKATQVVAVDSTKREAALMWPHFLPDGRHFLYLTMLVDETTRALSHMLRTASVDGGDRADIGVIDSRALFDRTGHLLYARDGGLFAQPFDPAARTFTGEPAMLAERFHYFRSTGLADFAISSTGTLAYRTPPPPSRLVWLDREGIEVGRLGDEALYGEPRISADGARVAVDISDPAQGTGDLWVFDRSLGTSVRVTFSPADERTPIWSRDGTALFYASDAAGPPDLYRRVLNSGRDDLLLKTEGIETPNDISPDGLELLFYRPGRGTSGDLWRLRLDGTAQAAVLHQTPAGESSGRFSPDGRWVAYDSNESGRFEAYIQSIDNSGLRWKVSQGSGVNPEWGRNGTELFFVGTDSRLMSVPIRTTPAFQPGTPRPLFRISSPFYTVLPDASRFLVIEPGRPAGPPIHAITNWQRLAGRRSP